MKTNLMTPPSQTLQMPAGRFSASEDSRWSLRFASEAAKGTLMAFKKEANHA